MLPAQKSPRLPLPRRPTAGEFLAERLPSLTGLRFFAAFLVFLCHALSQFNPQTDSVSHDVAYFLLPAGPVGVSFFVLSGFVLTYAARPGDTVRRFWRRRVVRSIRATS
ncbi:acyltransferase family protein [Streptomyces sp. KL116D]|uniref:acyltransferase family protein n=1 Tax=Streptomyces sp. KL116D TaxID=3045152 RepID=UPI0035571F53